LKIILKLQENQGDFPIWLKFEVLSLKKSKFTEEQIAFASRITETGTRVAEVCRKFGIKEQTFYRLKKYSGLGVSVHKL
jgi:DNA invertase Pin-like site-specific DNA recombinase